MRRLRYTVGLFLVGAGEAIADFGAWVVGGRRLPSHLFVTPQERP